MIDFLLWITMTSYWAALFLGTIGLIAIRLAAALKAKLSIRPLLRVVLIPFSIGYYQEFPVARPYRTLHRIVSALVMGLSLLASVWVLYTRYA